MTTVATVNADNVDQLNQLDSIRRLAESTLAAVPMDADHALVQYSLRGLIARVISIVSGLHQHLSGEADCVLWSLLPAGADAPADLDALRVELIDEIAALASMALGVIDAAEITVLRLGAGRKAEHSADFPRARLMGHRLQDAAESLAAVAFELN